MSAGLKTRSIKGIAWTTGEGVGVALLSFAAFVIIARSLQPEDFGVVALAGVFIFFFNLLTGHTFSDAIVQRARLEPDHLDTAFWSTLALALALMGLCLVGADVAAWLLNEPTLAPVLRWLSLILPLSALGSMQLALFRRDMRFDTVAVRVVSGRAVGAAVGIGMALSGYGLWSLVGQQLVGVFVTTFLVAFSTWRPRLRFSFAHFREMWSFGFSVSANQIVSGAGEQTLNLMIGTLFGSAALGYFTIAWRMVQLIKSLISSAVYYVGLSAFARLQHERQALASAYLQSTRISCLIGFPIAVGLTLVGEPLITALFSHKWDASIPLLMILAFEMVPAFFGIFMTALYRAMGKPAWGLWTACLYLGVGIVFVLAAAPMGLTAVAILWVVRALVLMPVHLLLVRRLLGVSLATLCRPILTPMFASAAMAAAVLAVQLALERYQMNPIAELAATVPVGALVYAGAVWLMSPELAGMFLRTATVMATPLRKTN